MKALVKATHEFRNEALLQRIRHRYNITEVRRMDKEREREEAQILWDFLRLNQPLEKSDVIIGLGCCDKRVAERSAALFLEGWAPLLLFTGNLGARTAGVWPKPEAEVFLDVALGMGVPRESILLEAEATNTGENIRFSYRLLKERNIQVSSVILVQQPFMERRVDATFKHQWPKEGELPKAIVTSPELKLHDYFDKDVATASDLIISMLDTVDRMERYPKEGFQVEQHIPPRVWAALDWFRTCSRFKQ